MALLLVAGCSSDGSDGSSSDDPATALAERVQDVLASAEGGAAVVERLAALGIDVTAADLADAPLPRCPRVHDPAPGDEATCRVTVGGQELEFVVEFGADGTIQLVDAGVAR